MIALAAKVQPLKQASKVVRGELWKAQFAAPPPVDHTGKLPAFTMLLVKTKCFIREVGATWAPTISRLFDGKAVT